MPGPHSWVGQLHWTYPVDGAISSTPAVGADGTLYFGAANVARFHAVSASGTTVVDGGGVQRARRRVAGAGNGRDGLLRRG
jgi:outer membrane protein assembly factor BamB